MHTQPSVVIGNVAENSILTVFYVNTYNLSLNVIVVICLMIIFRHTHEFILVTV